MRYTSLTLALFAASLLPSTVLAAAPSLTGNWQLDPAQSQIDHNQTITLNIQENSDQLSFTRHVHDRDGKEIVSNFSCPVNGTSCEFDENSHKAKGSAWRDGATLFILKSEGPHENSSSEWQVQLSPDGQTLNVQYTELTPDNRTEKHVFHKAS